MKALTARLRQEGGGPKHCDEQVERMHAPLFIVGKIARPPVEEIKPASGQVERFSEIDFQKIFRDG